MQKGWLPGLTFILLAVVVIHTGCGGSSTAVPTGPPTSSSPQSASTTVPLAANTALPIPALAGFSGMFMESNANAGMSVKLTSYANVPNGGPQPLAVRRAASGTTSPAVGTAIFLVKQSYSGSMTFSSFPITKWLIPPSFAQAGPFELETIDGTTGLLLDTELGTGPDASGAVSFPGDPLPFQAASGHTYWWELITGFASPAPPGCSPNSVGTALNPAGQTIAQPTLCNFSGTLQISANNAPSGAMINVNSYVPAQTGMAGPPAPTGTTTGLLSLGTDVTGSMGSVTFANGFFAFTAHLPSAIPAGGKTFLASACTIKSTVDSHGNVMYLGCVDTPTSSGPLAVTGQRVTFGGLTSAFTLPGSVDSCHKICPPKTFYDYTVSIYY